jgi:hypothetical protein
MELGLILGIFESPGLNLQDYRGLRAKTRDGGLISSKPRVSLRKLPCEGVSGESNCWIKNRRPRLDMRPRARGGGGGGRALTGGTGSVSDRGGECADRAGPAPEGKRTATRVRGGPSRSIKIGRGGVRRGSERVRVGPRGSKRV